MDAARAAQAAPAVVQGAAAIAVVEGAEDEAERPHGGGQPAEPDADEPQGICTALSIDLPTGTQTIHLVRMQDRSRGERVSTYVIQAQLEKALYGTEASNGAVVTAPPALPLWCSLTASSPPFRLQYKLLQRNDLLGVILPINKAQVAAGHTSADGGLPLRMHAAPSAPPACVCRSGHAGRV
jgi:hypothetical protein